jgi:hypothetical protein
LRLSFKPGSQITAKVKVLIENETAARQGSKGGGVVRTVVGFSFIEEEHVDEVSADGTATLSVRLVDAVGEAGANADPQMVDQMALALDELRIGIKRTERGEVSTLTLSGVRKPLDEGTARSMFNALYGGQRGPLLPEARVEVGATWKNTVQLPETSGFKGAVVYDYAYRSIEGEVALIGSDGVADGKGTSAAGAMQHLIGRSTAEFKLDVGAGRFRASSLDQTMQTEQTTQQATQSGVRTHLHVQWQLDETAPAKKEKP